MRSFYWMALLPALAAAPVQSETKPPAEKPKPKLVCFSERPTGSHIRKRTCMTEAAHEERRRADQDAARRMKDKIKPLDSSK